MGTKNGQEKETVFRFYSIGLPDMPDFVQASTKDARFRAVRSLSFVVNPPGQ